MDGYPVNEKVYKTRQKNQLPPIKWNVLLEVIDSPGPGEDYLSDAEIASPMNSVNLPVGLSLSVQKMERSK